LHAYHAALEEIGQMPLVHFTDPEVLAGLRREYEQKIEREMASLNELHIDKQQFHKEELLWARRHLLLVEKGKVIDAFRKGVLNQAVQEKLLVAIDTLLLHLETGETESSVEKKRALDHADAHNLEETIDV
jgi:hypothetical protein